MRGGDKRDRTAVCLSPGNRLDSKFPKSGGDKDARTPDLLTAGHRENGATPPLSME